MPTKSEPPQLYRHKDVTIRNLFLTRRSRNQTSFTQGTTKETKNTKEETIIRLTASRRRLRQLVGFILKVANRE